MLFLFFTFPRSLSRQQINNKTEFVLLIYRCYNSVSGSTLLVLLYSSGVRTSTIVEGWRSGSRRSIHMRHPLAAFIPILTIALLPICQDGIFASTAIYACGRGDGFKNGNERTTVNHYGPRIHSVKIIFIRMTFRKILGKKYMKSIPT